MRQLGMQTAGFVLVGGHSTRMGTDKARLPVGSHLLVEEVAASVASLTGSATLVGQSHRYQDLPYASIDDLHAGAGPLSGIHAALASRQAAWNLIVSCDIPGLRTAWLEQLISAAASCNGGAQCIVCRDASGQAHPLCGVWQAGSLTTVESALKKGRHRLFDVLDDLQASYTTVPESILNVNTPGEWNSWLLYRENAAGRP